MAPPKATTQSFQQTTAPMQEEVSRTKIINLGLTKFPRTRLHQTKGNIRTCQKHNEPMMHQEGEHEHAEHGKRDLCAVRTWVW